MPGMCRMWAARAAVLLASAVGLGAAHAETAARGITLIVGDARFRLP